MIVVPMIDDISQPCISRMEENKIKIATPFLKEYEKSWN